MLISDDYLAQNKQLHTSTAGYGAGGWVWIGPILATARKYGAVDVLDYGAGKGTLAAWMPPTTPVVSYDPVTYPDDPPPCDLVACLDVMEHIEPDNLSSVLKHLRSKTLKVAFFVISTRPAKKVLPDGRNAHLIVEEIDFWRARLLEHFAHVEKLGGFDRADELVLVAWG